MAFSVRSVAFGMGDTIFVEILSDLDVNKEYSELQKAVKTLCTLREEDRFSEFLTYENMAGILLAKGLNVWATDFNAHTTLHIAAICEGEYVTEVAKIFLAAVSKEKRFEFVMRFNNDGHTVLHVAAMYGHTEMAKVLVDSLENQDQRVAFLSAEVRERKGLSRITPHFFEEDLGKTALYFAVRNGQAEIAKVLLGYYKQLGIEIPQDLLPILKERGFLE